MRFHWQAATHVGRVRGHNEDAWMVAAPGEVFLSAAGAVAGGSGRGELLAVVSDGVGGEAAGEVASQLVVQGWAEFWSEHIGRRSRLDLQAREAWLARGVERLHERVRREGEAQPACAGMAATLALAWCTGPQLTVAHLGDSRVLLWRDGALTALTRDHSLGEEWREEGTKSAAEIARHSDRHVLTRVVDGATAGDRAEPTLRSLRLRRGDRLLLATDGLTGALAPADLCARLGAGAAGRSWWRKAGSRAALPEDLAISLVEAAVATDGRDNTTAIAIGAE